MKEIKLYPLTSSKVAIVDDEDFETLNKFHWSLMVAGYAYREEWNKMKRKKFTMHREIMSSKTNDVIDHKNGNPLDNRKENLRLCTQMENCRNQSIKSSNKSGYKGVSWDKRAGKWSAFLTVNYKHIFGGYFEDVKKAAESYNKMAIEHHGEFARLNTI